MPNVRFSAYSRNSLSDFTPYGGFAVKFMSYALKFENTTHFSLARVISTLSLLSPPSWFSGPKLSDIFPSWSYPYPTLMRMTSLSSPWIVSRFLTKNLSSLLSENNGSYSGCSLRFTSSSSRIAFFCATENVPTPKLFVSPYFSK